MVDCICDINLDCQVYVIEDFVMLDMVMIYLDGNFIGVIEVMDFVIVKVSIIYYCKCNKIFVVMVGGVGGQVDLIQIICGDLVKIIQDFFVVKF